MHRSPHPSAGTTSANGGNSDPGLSNAAELSACLLSWWQAYGRRDPLQKPWMFKPAGGWPEADHPLDPYGIWIAEVMLQQTQLAVASWPSRAVGCFCVWASGPVLRWLSRCVS